MRIGIVSRTDLQEALDLAREIIDYLSEEEIFLAPNLAKSLGRKETPVEKMNLDSLISIGGDGTVLRNLQKLPSTPVLGINMGGRGFLAEVNPDEALDAIDKMKKKELGFVERTRISVLLNGKWLADGLNEGVVRSKTPNGTLPFTIYLDDEKVEENEGDGLIVSTPTGSTAYALAAGGPIIDPKVKAFSAVSLSTLRPKTLPLVYPMGSELRMELSGKNKKAYVTIDGHITEVAGKGDTITFKKSDNSAKFYKWKGRFYQRIKEKL